MPAAPAFVLPLAQGSAPGPRAFRGRLPPDQGHRSALPLNPLLPEGRDFALLPRTPSIECSPHGPEGGIRHAPLWTPPRRLPAGWHR